MVKIELVLDEKDCVSAAHEFVLVLHLVQDGLNLGLKSSFYRVILFTVEGESKIKNLGLEIIIRDTERE